MFPAGRFAPPATEAAIAEVERALGVRLPEQLRRFYLECDGFREDRGNSKYLLSLSEKDVVGSLLSRTQFFWQEWPEYYPDLDLSPFVFFGDASGSESWGIDWRGGNKIIAYHHHMEGEFEVAGTDIAEVWRADYAAYPEG
jgi:hypothetical protein